MARDSAEVDEKTRYLTMWRAEAAATNVTIGKDTILFLRSLRVPDDGVKRFIMSFRDNIHITKTHVAKAFVSRKRGPPPNNGLAPPDKRWRKVPRPEEPPRPPLRQASPPQAPPAVPSAQGDEPAPVDDKSTKRKQPGSLSVTRSLTEQEQRLSQAIKDKVAQRQAEEKKRLSNSPQRPTPRQASPPQAPPAVPSAQGDEPTPVDDKSTKRKQPGSLSVTRSLTEQEQRLSQAIKDKVAQRQAEEKKRLSNSPQRPTPRQASPPQAADEPADQERKIALYKKLLKRAQQDSSSPSTT